MTIACLGSCCDVCVQLSTAALTAAHSFTSYRYTRIEVVHRVEKIVPKSIPFRQPHLKLHLPRPQARLHWQRSHIAQDVQLSDCCP